MSVKRVTIASMTCLVTLVIYASFAWGANPTLSPREQLGKKLFFDKISTPANQSCATCHAPSVGWTGAVPGLNRLSGIYPGAVKQRFGNRKPPASAYLGASPVFHMVEPGEFVGGMFWDGRATGERLGSPDADQALGPFLAPVEQNMPGKQSVCEVVAQSNYAALFEQVWGPGSLDCSDAGYEATYDKIGLSIAAYESSKEVSPFSSKYDLYWNDCLDAGNDPEACGLAEGEKSMLDPNNVLTLLEWDGLIEFGEYCAPCHTSQVPGPNDSPPLFTDFSFDNIGVPRNPENPFYDMDEVFLEDGSPINPEGDAFVDRGLGDFLRTRPEWAQYAPMNDGKFKVPTVRNVAKAPGYGFPKAYMHNGAFKSLADVVHFYNTRDVPEENWPAPEVAENVNRELLEGVPLGNLELDAHAEGAIVAFLGTLSDGFKPLPGQRPGGGGGLSSVAARVQLGPNVPNPFNPATRIRFVLAVPSRVELAVYSLDGRRVRTLAAARYIAGEHTVTWNGRDDDDRSVAAGIYLYRLQTDALTLTRKMVLVK